MIEPRPYQIETVQAILDYWRDGGGNPLVDLATGTGKSVCIAGLIDELLAEYPTLRVLALVHTRELVEQNVKAFLRVRPGSDVGINAAGLHRRDRHQQVLFASIQSVYREDGYSLGPRDLVLIDEAHLLPKKGEGMYRQLIEKLRQRVADLRVAGFTATPYRLDSGRLDEGEGRIFERIVFTYGIGDAVADGWLAPLVSKATTTGMDVSGVTRRGGEFVESDLQRAVDRDDVTEAACDEIVAMGEDRRSWLAFCAGVEHAFHVRNALRTRGITCEAVTGETPAGERDRLIRDFRAGRIRCLTNAMVLTTGFDVPGVDLIAMLRPTLSTGLYIQKCGRGTRPVYPAGFDPNRATAEERVAAIAASSKPNCLVLDFAGNVRRHGPVGAISMGGDAASGRPRAPVEAAVKPDEVRAKVCPNCSTLVGLGVFTCTAPGCGFEWEQPKPKHEAQADAEAVIMTGQRSGAPVMPDPWLAVTGIDFARHVKRHDPDAPPTLRVDYVCGFTGHSEWVCFEHDGVARAKAEKWWRDMRGRRPAPASVEEALSRCLDGETATPSDIAVKRDGKFMRVVSRRFSSAELARVAAFVVTPIVERESAEWWRVLGIDRHASTSEIKAAFRRLAREHHPDAGGSTAAMANINRAYREALAEASEEVPF
ncbi:DEAD/DEAH box helicase family protein [Methylorubrum extorquens]|uniref:DEAD/DEAH box helicase family protein n=1 Tax=Methylorubrum extorquens TaxID=408 RepID=UPI001EE525EB|nr:DEAD/DEAH box helicase family protein [Methylorubrum extorquens]MCG5247963.1 DEAD/DEAH box helicase family protein [Methylorubrum extorquens]